MASVSVQPSFQKGNFLIPSGIDMEKWAVIACDQYTSDPDYWNAVKDLVGNAPSALHLILPEIYLEPDNSHHVRRIRDSITDALAENILKYHGNCCIYIERLLPCGLVRKGLVGVVDLEAYSWQDPSASIRPTEQTIPERIVPRKAIRQNSEIELSHIILFANDAKNQLMSALEAQKERLPKVYDFDLMMSGGHITGWLVKEDMLEDFQNRYLEYAAAMEAAGYCQLVVGDGNHSLATAKAIYEESGKDPFKRYAMVEMQNIYDDAVIFKPIHRVLFDIDPAQFLEYVQESIPGDFPVEWKTADNSGTMHIHVEDGQLAIEALQPVLDAYLQAHPGRIDYVHDGIEDILERNPGSIGIFCPDVDKSSLFERIASKDVYPRKTFSVGDPNEKRFYLEARFIL